MRVLLAPLLAAIFTVAASSQTAPGARSLDRVGLVEAWLEAVDRHTPGLADESARAVGAWSARELVLRATGDAVAAVNMLGRLIEPSNDAPDDPWWRYHITAGRSLERRMHALWASTPAPVRP